MKSERVLTGVGLVAGRGKGRVFKFKPSKYSSEDLIEVVDRVAKEFEREDDLFGKFVKMLLKDDTFRDRLQTCLKLGVTQEEAIDIALRPLVERLRGSDPFFSRKADEIVHMVHDALRSGILDLPVDEGTIFVAERISVPVALKLRSSKVAAVLVRELSSDSHAAIILANAKIPTVIGIDPDELSDGEMVYVDGESGIVSREPIKLMPKKEYIKRGRIFYTFGGEEVEILINVDVPDDVFWAERYGTGVGLLRAEYLINIDLSKVDWERFANLQAPVIIRAYDVGGEKFYGKRTASRLLSDLKDKFDALIEVVARYPNFRIMIPMVDFPETARTFHEYVKSKGLKDIGFMIEVPSFAWSLKEVNGYASFFSVGTNDLWAFFSGRERGKSDIKEQINPTFGEFLKHILKSTTKPVSVCGQLASDRDGLEFLLSLGYRRFSVSPSFFPQAVNVVEKWHGKG